MNVLLWVLHRAVESNAGVLASAGTGIVDGRAAVHLLPEVGVPYPRSRVANIVPFVPVVAGLWLSALRFRVHDSLGGLAFGLGGMLLMLVLATWLSRHE